MNSVLAPLHVSLISYAASFDTAVHPYLLHTAAADNQTAQALAAIIAQNRWRLVGILSTADEFGVQGTAALSQLLRAAGTNAIPATPVNRFVPNFNATVASLKLLREQNVRCFVIFARQDAALALMSAADSLGLFGDGFVWLLADNTPTSVSTGSLDVFSTESTSNVVSGALILQRNPGCETYQQIKYARVRFLLDFRF